jgi:Acyltransferase family
MGHSWVAIFFILLGFVNALKPLKLSRQNKLDAALANLAQASFRRTFRLMLPAGAATIISWFICQLGFYTSAHRGDAYWTLTYTPWPSDSWADAVTDLLRALKYTWMFWTDNPYDQPQWALVYLLYGSMVVFTSLLITLAMRPPWRASAMVLFTVWSLDWTRLVRDRGFLSLVPYLSH